MTPPTPDWLRRAQVLCDMGRVAEAIDVVMDAVGDLVDARRFEATDDALEALSRAEVPPDLQLAALTITHASLQVYEKVCLMRRPALYAACWKALDAAGEDAEVTLRGLA